VNTASKFKRSAALAALVWCNPHARQTGAATAPSIATAMMRDMCERRIGASLFEDLEIETSAAPA
jgi:hypothetical protein